MRSVRWGLLCVVGTGLVLGLGCGDDSTGPDSTERGALEVWLNLTGSATDPDGCTVAVLGRTPRPIAAGETVMFSDLPVGTHVVTLADVAASCAVSTENPRSVTVLTDQTSQVRFDVTCGDATPNEDLAGMEALGSGYNLTGNYADIADVKAVVLDLGALQAADLLRQVQYERATYNVVSGENSHAYQRNIAASVRIGGSALAFSGALKASFKQDRYESKHYSFATVRSVIRKHGLRVALYVTPEQLRGYLTAPAAAAINDPSVDPLYLFEVFGTHVLTGVIVGGRLDFSTSANMSFEQQNRSIDVYARASFKSAFASASIEAQATDQLSWNEYSASEERHLEVYGGRSEYGQYIMNAGVYESWIESIEDNSVFMDFESTGLLGIWELADDASRRSALAAAWNTYAAARGITMSATGSIVSDFAQDAEGWKYGTWTKWGTLVHHTGYSFFGGWVLAVEDANYHGMEFWASDRYLGDKTIYAGGILEYYLWYCTSQYLLCVGQAPPATAQVPYLVRIASENGNLSYRPTTTDSSVDPAHIPQVTPTHYVIPLKAGLQPGPGGTVTYQWVRWDGQPATDEDIWVSLAKVRELQIWGAFRGWPPGASAGGEQMALDKVVLRAPSGP